MAIYSADEFLVITFYQELFSLFIIDYVSSYKSFPYRKRTTANSF